MLLNRNATRRRERKNPVGYLVDAASYRVALPVTKLIQYPTYGDCYPLCPRCGRSMEREYMNFCDRCGQRLNWDRLNEAMIIVAPVEK